MTGRLRTSQAGLDLIKSFEGFRDTAVRLPDGRWTIGFGHVRTAREGLSIGEKDAEDLLRRDIAPAEDIVQSGVFAPLSQNQFDALVSLAFNISPVQFRDSDVLRALNAGDFIMAADGFDAWRSARVNGRLIIVDALVRRRALEKAMFLEHPAGRPVAPTPLVTPEKMGSAGPVSRVAVTEAPVKARPAQATFEAANDESGAEGSGVDTEVGRAVRELAERVARHGAAVATRPEPEDVPEETDDLVQERPLEDARREMAERVKRILERADVAIAQHQEAQKAGPIASAAMQAAVTAPVTEPVKEPAKEVVVVREGLPDFDAPTERSGLAGSGAGSGNGRAFIDDTETYNPGRDPAELFAEGERRERQANGHAGLQLGGSAGRLAPWLVVLILAALGLAVAFAEMFGGGSALGRANAAPTVFAVFGLMLVMSLYFISTRRRDLDS